MTIYYHYYDSHRTDAQSCGGFSPPACETSNSR
jgi:hypothetical protein